MIAKNEEGFFAALRSWNFLILRESGTENNLPYARKNSLFAI
jgi:hypothetical protein